MNTLKKVNETLNVFLFFCIPQLLQFRKKLDMMEEKNGTKGTVKTKNSLYLFLVFDYFSTKRSCLCNCKMNTRWNLQEVQFVGTAEGKQSPQARIEMSNFTTLKACLDPRSNCPWADDDDCYYYFNNNSYTWIIKGGMIALIVTCSDWQLEPLSARPHAPLSY